MTVSIPASVRVRAPAKINLHLGVGPLGDDGYHDVATVYATLSLVDELVAAPADRLTLAVAGEGAAALPTGAANLAVRAATALATAAGVPAAVALTLHKHIPVAGGMAGGSADAAAALVACDALWGLRTPPATMHALAASLGSDVPFALLGGTARGVGRGERLTPLDAPHTRHWVVAPAGRGLSTPAVYGALDRLRGPAARTAAPTPVDRVEAALADPDPGVLATALHNDLEPAALSLRPDLARVREAGLAAGALAALLSGSGPTWLFLAADGAHATSLALVLGPHAPGVRTVFGPLPGAGVVTD